MFATKKAKNKCVCNKKRLQKCLQKVNIFRKSLCLQKIKYICKNVILVKFNELLYSTLTKHHNIHTNRKQF